MIENLIKWSKNQHSHLPWRVNRSLYHTLVSEIMLQQTTVGTVKNHFERFIEFYPNIQSLADSTEEELTVQWKGLGYYRRARNLHKAAKYIVDNHQGKIPLDYETLISIPGIGDYTASAILAIGADKKAIALDANIERVLARLFNVEMEKGPKLHKELKQIFLDDKFFKKVKSHRDFNEALMDLGRVLCQARKTDCSLCPLMKSCKSFQRKTQLDIPIKKDIAKESYEITLARILVKKNGKVLVYQKSNKEWLHGQYELPTYLLQSKDPKLKQYPKLNQSILPKKKLFKSFKTGITKYKITNNLYILSESDFKKLPQKFKLQFKNIDRNENLSTSTFKALKQIGLMD